ncbi:MAG: esterase [Lachnospiraceae bacterium]|nr:esterase [Lachnospiraceae bacterium]
MISTVMIQPVDDREMSFIDDEIASIRNIYGADFRLVPVRVDNWNDDLSPWEAPPVFGREGFGGGAAGTLARIAKITCDRSCRYIIGGYSLAGLFAIWAAYQTDVFAAVAAASPSVWFPSFAQYAADSVIRTKKVYLSLGDTEERTKNPVMSTVGDNIRAIHSHLLDSGIKCTLEWNSGDHFKEVRQRTAKAFAWAASDL